MKKSIKRLDLNLRDVIHDKSSRCYIVDYTLRDRVTCKTCTVREFLIELLEYTETEIAHIMKIARFRHL